VFVTVAVLPTARDGTIDPETLGAVVGRFRTLSRVSVLLLFVTGSHMAGTRYTVDSLAGSPRGHLVVTMLVLWFVLAALVEVGSGRVTDGVAAEKVRTPGAAATPVFRAAAAVAVLLLADAGLLAAGIP